MILCKSVTGEENTAPASSVPNLLQNERGRACLGTAAVHILSSILREAQASRTASSGSSESVLCRAPEPLIRTEPLGALSALPAD